MKIKTQVRTTKEVEIAFPFFRKKTEGGWVKYSGVLNEQTVFRCTILRNSEYASILFGRVEDFPSEIVTEFSEWETISEEEFMEAHSKLLESLSLEPKLITNDLP